MVYVLVGPNFIRVIILSCQHELGRCYMLQMYCGINDITSRRMKDEEED